MIKDIVNRDSINLANCESEPIHVPGSIQPHGFVLALAREGLVIDFCSANIGAYISFTPEALLGRPLKTVFPEEEVSSFEGYIAGFIAGTTYPHVFTFNEVSYNTTVTENADYYLLEFEPFPDGSLHLPDLYKQTKKFISFVEGSTYLQDLCQSVADESRAITGYDRVMIYRFDKEYNGEVFAESVRDDLVPFLGHHYPHTDIPVQARELYMRNLVRLIPDVSYEPVPLLTLNSMATNNSLDLSNSILRSVSPIHIEYLKNMGVGATLTVSLIHNGRLWGLIACHHYSPKNLPHYTRLATQLQAHFLTSQISVREVKEEYEVAQRSEVHLLQLQHLLQDNLQFIKQQYANPALLAMTQANGVAIMHEKKIYSNGLVPAGAQVEELVKWLIRTAPTGHYTTSNLAEDYEEAAAIADITAGIIYQSLGKDDDCIIWFRPEVVKTIEWAGDPDKAMLPNENDVRLSPRKSFDIWKQFVRLQSIPWARPHINSAAAFAYALQKHILFQYLSKEEERYRKLSEKLQEANDELANINWISTHDLKEPLRKIQIFGSRILESDKENLSEGITDAVTRMRSAAGRMQLLLDDILAYSNLSHKKQAFGMVDLRLIVDDVIASLKEEITAAGAQINTGNLPVIHGITFQLQQLFQNLLGNALKFARPGVPLIVNISATIEPAVGDEKAACHKIDVADNGIGFENTYGSRIFEVFQRLHTTAEYVGTGIGLSICKKVMANHNGFITAQGEPGKGATFSLFFPVNA